MSNYVIKVGVHTGPDKVKRVSFVMETADGDLAASCIMGADAAKVTANGLIEAARIAEAKIITNEPLPHFTVGSQDS